MRIRKFENYEALLKFLSVKALDREYLAVQQTVDDETTYLLGARKLAEETFVTDVNTKLAVSEPNLTPGAILSFRRRVHVAWAIARIVKAIR